MTLSLQLSYYLIIPITGSLSVKGTGGYPVMNLLVTCVHVLAKKTSDVIVHSHIEIVIFISMTLTMFVFPFSHQP